MNAYVFKRCIATGIVVCLSGCCSPKAVHSAYEYRVDNVTFQASPRSGLQEYVDLHAPEGWVLDHLVERGGQWTVVMKRAKR